MLWTHLDFSFIVYIHAEIAHGPMSDNNNRLEQCHSLNISRIMRDFNPALNRRDKQHDSPIKCNLA